MVLLNVKKNVSEILIEVNSSSEPIFKELNILKFNHLFELNCKLFMHAFYNSKLPPCFSEMFKKSVSMRTNNVVTNICKKSNLRHLPKYILPKLWNSMSQESKCLSSRSSFKRKLITEYISSYES